MAYKNIDDQKAAARRHYERNKDAYLARAAKHKAKYRKEIRSMIQTIKESTPCSDCDRSFPYFVMQFDHVMGEKSFNIGDVSSGWFSRERVLAEIQKCDVVCANCHAFRTHHRSGRGQI